MALSGSSSEAEAIQRQMREMRVELRDDMREMVVSANHMADISRYVKAYPWLCVGAALAAGYFIVPQRPVVIRPDAESLAELAKKHKLVVKTEEEEVAKKKRGGLFSQLVGMAAAALLQGGLKIATHQLSQALSPPHHHANGSNGKRGEVPT